MAASAISTCPFKLALSFAKEAQGTLIGIEGESLNPDDTCAPFSTYRTTTRDHVAGDPCHPYVILHFEGGEQIIATVASLVYLASPQLSDGADNPNFVGPLTPGKAYSWTRDDNGRPVVSLL